MHEGSASDPFAILYTSGTMGKPKGVALSHANLLTTAAATADALGLGPDDVVFGLNTLFNVFGLGTGVLGTLAGGGSIVSVDAQGVIRSRVDSG